jgi:hypothetical protein
LAQWQRSAGLHLSTQSTLTWIGSESTAIAGADAEVELFPETTLARGAASMKQQYRCSQILRRPEALSLHHALLYCARDEPCMHPSLLELEAFAAAEADALKAEAEAAEAAQVAEALRLREQAMAGGTYHSAEGYDDADFQLATKHKCEKDFFSDFQFFVPSNETKVGQEWTVHCLFDFQQESPEPGILGVVSSHKRMCSAQSHLFHVDDGPIAILHGDDDMFLEIVLQVATQFHYPASISNVLLGAPALADGYPRELAERRRMYSSMMEQHRHVLQLVTERQGANEAQLKVLLRLPRLPLSQTGASHDVASPACTLLALGFDVRFEGYLGAFGFRALLSAKVIGSLSHAQSDALAKQLKLFPTILPKSSYRCSTDEPPVFHRGVLLVHVRSARSLPKADHVPGRKSDAYCVLSVVHRSIAGSSQRTAVKAKTLDPVWDENEYFRFDVLDAHRDVLRIDVFDENKVTKDVLLASLELPVADIAGHSEIELTESEDEGTWMLTPAPPFSAPSNIQLKLRWMKTLMPERDAHEAFVAAEIEAVRKQAAASRAAEVAARLAVSGHASSVSKVPGREA